MGGALLNFPISQKKTGRARRGAAQKGDIQMGE